MMGFSGFLFICCSLLAAPSPVQTTKDESVKRVILETDGGIVATAWAEKLDIKEGQDIIVNYSMRNNSKRTIYVVTQPKPEIYTDTTEITIREPLPRFHDVNAEYNFSFHEVKPNQVYRSKLTIPASEIKGEGLWDIGIGLAYVYDKEGIDRKRGEDEDPIQLPGLLVERAKRIRLGSLEVGVIGRILSRE